MLNKQWLGRGYYVTSSQNYLWWDLFSVREKIF